MFFQQIINGLTIGCCYSLVTLGFSMIYGVIGLTNFAHSSYYMLGAYLAMVVITNVAANPQTLILAILVAMVVCGFVSAGVDVVCLRKIRKDKITPVSAMLCTVGVQTIINNLIILIWGSQTRSFPAVMVVKQIEIKNVVISYMQIILLVLAMVIMAVFSFIVYKTKYGAAMRAISQNPRAAQMMGIKVNRVIATTFFIAATISAISGVMIGLYYQYVNATMANVVSSKAFAAAILGGIGELPGAVLGGLIIGVLEALVAAYISSGYRDAIAFAVLILVLLIRPQGIMGKKSADKV